VSVRIRRFGKLLGYGREIRRPEALQPPIISRFGPSGQVPCGTTVRDDIASRFSGHDAEFCRLLAGRFFDHRSVAATPIDVERPRSAPSTPLREVSPKLWMSLVANGYGLQLEQMIPDFYRPIPHHRITTA
jgi:hypothetical protein